MRSSSRMRAPTKQSTQLVGCTRTHTHTFMTSCVRFPLSQSVIVFVVAFFRFHSLCARLEKHLKIRWNAINLMNTVVSNIFKAQAHWDSEPAHTLESIELIVALFFLQKKSKRREKKPISNSGCCYATLPTDIWLDIIQVKINMAKW